MRLPLAVFCMVPHLLDIPAFFVLSLVLEKDHPIFPVFLAGICGGCSWLWRLQHSFGFLFWLSEVLQLQHFAKLMLAVFVLPNLAAKIYLKTLWTWEHVWTMLVNIWWFLLLLAKLMLVNFWMCATRWLITAAIWYCSKEPVARNDIVVVEPVATKKAQLLVGVCIDSMLTLFVVVPFQPEQQTADHWCNSAWCIFPTCSKRRCPHLGERMNCWSSCGSLPSANTVCSVPCHAFRKLLVLLSLFAAKLQLLMSWFWGHLWRVLVLSCRTLVAASRKFTLILLFLLVPFVTAVSYTLETLPTADKVDAAVPPAVQATWAVQAVETFKKENQQEIMFNLCEEHYFGHNAMTCPREERPFTNYWTDLNGAIAHPYDQIDFGGLLGLYVRFWHRPGSRGCVHAIHQVALFMQSFPACACHVFRSANFNSKFW